MPQIDLTFDTAPSLVCAMSAGLDKPHGGRISGDTHLFALRVYIEDTDLGGVVYHANYIRFLERARSDLLRTVGIDQRASFEAGQGIYAVTELHMKYCSPARLDDELVVASRVAEIRRVSSVVAQKILRRDEVLAEAMVTVAFLGPDGRPKRQPAAWVERFRQMMPASLVHPVTGAPPI